MNTHRPSRTSHITDHSPSHMLCPTTGGGCSTARLMPPTSPTTPPHIRYAPKWAVQHAPPVSCLPRRRPSPLVYVMPHNRQCSMHCPSRASHVASDPPSHKLRPITGGRAHTARLVPPMSPTTPPCVHYTPQWAVQHPLPVSCPCSPPAPLLYNLCSLRKCLIICISNQNSQMEQTVEVNDALSG